MTSSGEPKRIEPVFPDGLLAYDCASCTDNCCGGHGLGFVRGDEAETLLKLYPALTPFVGSAVGSLLDATNFRPGCHFLDRDDLCSIERELGHDKKPTLCRLFPTNKLMVYGDTILVDVHPLCTLGLTHYGGASARALGHEPLLETFSETILTIVASQPREPYEKKLAPFSRDLLPLERLLRDRAEAFFEAGDLHGYLVFQAEQTDALRPGGETRPVPMEPDSIRRVQEEMAAFFGLAPPILEGEDALRSNRILTALACSFRSRLLVEAAGASNVEDGLGFYRAMARLPWSLVALEFLFRAAVSLNPDRNVVTVANGICSKQSALLRILAMFPMTPRLSGELSSKLELVPGIQKPFFELLRRLSYASRSPSRPTLSEAVRAIDIAPEERSALLRAVDQHGDVLLDWFPETPEREVEGEPAVGVGR